MKVVQPQLVLIVGMSKITSAFEDIMEIENEPVFKGNVKRAITKFQKWYNEYSKTVVTLFYKDPNNAKFFEQTISGFDKYDQYYDLGSEKCTRMALIYAKLYSASNDFKKIPGENIDDSSYGLFISMEITKLLSNKFWKMFVDMEDLEGANCSNLIESLDSIGSELYLKEEKENVS